MLLGLLTETGGGSDCVPLSGEDICLEVALSHHSPVYCIFVHIYLATILLGVNAEGTKMFCVDNTCKVRLLVLTPAAICLRMRSSSLCSAFAMGGHSIDHSIL